jgi:hypothetical protein
MKIWAHLRRKTPQTGLSAPIFWLRQKDFRYNPLRRAAGEFAERKFAASPLRDRDFTRYWTGSYILFNILKTPWASTAGGDNDVHSATHCA